MAQNRPGISTYRYPPSKAGLNCFIRSHITNVTAETDRQHGTNALKLHSDFTGMRVLYGFETWSVTLRKEQKLRDPEIRMLFEPEAAYTLGEPSL
jgi:hypothetical protein